MTHTHEIKAPPAVRARGANSHINTETGECSDGGYLLPTP